MLLLHDLQLRGRHVQPLLFLAAIFCLPVKSEFLPGGCHDAHLNITRARGEQWMLPNCGGFATCRFGPSGTAYISTVSCPVAPCRRLDDGDPSAPFPRCCPRLSCPGCHPHPEKPGQSAGPVSSWTDDHCILHQCLLGPSGELQRYERACEPLGLPPSLDCEVVEQDMSRGGYPLCCAHYRCPGLCRSGDTWRPRAVREDSCGHQPEESTGWWD